MMLDVSKSDGETLGEKIAAAFEALPLTGGVLDCRTIGEVV